MTQNTDEIWRLVEANQQPMIELSDRIWGMPELCYNEHRSCAEHTAALHEAGFRVTGNVAEIPTAVMGEAGEGGPIIAILGEYDALPGLSQEADVAEPRPLPGDGTGHGCGHNLLGTAAMLSSDMDDTNGIIITPMTMPAAKALSDAALLTPSMTAKSRTAGATVNAAKYP